MLGNTLGEVRRDWIRLQLDSMENRCCIEQYLIFVQCNNKIIKTMKLIFKIWVFITPLYCLNLVAQTNKTIVSDFSDSTVKLYYLNVYYAESCLKNDRIDSALKYYTDARKVFGLYQLNDRRNVMKCLYSCSDTFILKEWFRFGYYCAADSIGPERYMELYHSFIPESLSSNLLKTLQQTTKMNWAYIDEHEQISRILAPLYEIDQQYRSNEFQNSADKSIIKKRRKADKQNFAVIMSCYRRFGDFSTNRFSGKYANAKEAYKYILLHVFINTDIRKKYSDFFIKQVTYGNLDARVYAEIADNYLFDSSQVYGCHTSFYYNDTLVVYELSPPYKNRINENRSQIFLQEIDTVHQKQVWAWQNYSIYSFETLWVVNPEKSTDTIKEIAEKYKALMGPMVVGYTIYSR